MDYYKKEVKEVFSEFSSSSSEGLSKQKVKARLKIYGFNQIQKTKKLIKSKIFINQFKDIMVILLLIATVVSFLIGERLDATIILAIVLFNSLFGFFQEYKAEKAIEALKKLTGLKARVIRDSQEIEIDSKKIIPGDVIVLVTGDKVPADARIIESFNLEVDESSLTGESNPTQKNSEKINGNVTLAEQKNMIFSSTIITKGHAKAIVVSTGMKTQIGKIAKSMQEVKEEKTPLQLKLAKLSKFIGIIILVITAIIFLVELKSQNYFQSLLFGISLAVAAIPEGLPAVVTIAFALGVRKMIKKRALIRKLPSIETLGSVDIICTDKTGTLTKNQMTVTKLFANDEIISVSGKGYNPSGVFFDEKQKSYDFKKISKLLKAGALCNDASLINHGDKWRIIGDPTEASLLVSARKANLVYDDILKDEPRIEEIPFDSEKKYMITVHTEKGKKMAYAKGAPEQILYLCNKIEIDGKIKKLDRKTKERIIKKYDGFAKLALRVLAFAYKQQKGKEKYDNNLVFLGLQAMIDPPREGVKESIETTRKAGIKTIMITGDFEITAKAIANEIGIKGKTLNGTQLEKMTDYELERIVEDIGIYARVNPEHKLKIVKALQKKGHVVAMTGDGVNDAPALKKANVGVAVGSGTDVAKEAAHMIIIDDNFSDIVFAIEEGRGIFDNIRKFVTYMLSCNIAEVSVIAAAIAFGLPLPLTAVQILWINIVTDGFPALALSVDPKEEGIMERHPRKIKEGILTRNLTIIIFSLALLLTLGSLLLVGYADFFEKAKIQTLLFTSLVVFEMVTLFVVRSEFKVKFFSNRYLFYAVSSSILLQLLVIYTPLNLFFKTVPLDVFDWMFIGVVALVLIGASIAIKKIIDSFFTKKTKNIN